MTVVRQVPREDLICPPSGPRFPEAMDHCVGEGGGLYAAMVAYSYIGVYIYIYAQLDSLTLSIHILI